MVIRHHETPGSSQSSGPGAAASQPTRTRLESGSGVSRTSGPSGYRLNRFRLLPVKFLRRIRPDLTTTWGRISSKAARNTAIVAVSVLLVGVMSAVALSYGGSSTQEPHPVLSTNKAVAAGLAAVPFQHVVVPAAGEVSPTAPAMRAPAQSSRPNSEVPASRPAAAVVENSAPFSISCHNSVAIARRNVR